MATTMLRKELQDEMINLMFQTFPKEEEPGVICRLTIVDIKGDQIEIVDGPNIYDINETEEQFHRELRKKAAELDQLLTSHSTDPEWNPENYVKHLDQVLKDEEHSRNNPLC